jgi:hypothetical protein
MPLNFLTKFINSKKLEDKLSLFAILYFMTGIIFALYYAYYYHWEFYAYFSPGFFMVVFTWPFQILHGFMADILYYGPGGKPI